MYTTPYDMNQSKRYLADEIEQALCKAALQADGANQQLTIPLMTAFVQKLSLKERLAAQRELQHLPPGSPAAVLGGRGRKPGPSTGRAPG